MTVVKRAVPLICSRCLHRQLTAVVQHTSNGIPSRSFTNSTALPQSNEQSFAKQGKESELSEDANRKEEKLGGMSRRLVEMTDDAIEQGGRSARKAMDEGGFSDELKKKLEARIQESAFQGENAAAFAQVNMPVRSESYNIVNSPR